MKKRKDGLYQKKIKIDGKPKVVYGKTQKEVNEKIDNLKKANIPTEKHNFKELADKMIEEKEKTVGHKTVECYKQALNKLIDIHDLNIEDVTPQAIESILNKLNAQGISKSLITKTRLVYGMTAKYAIKSNINITNYIDVIEIPKNAHEGKREAISDEDINTINRTINDKFGLYPFMMLYTGLRRGELLALKWGSVDINNKIIFIDKSIEFVGNRPFEKTPKTKSGVRQVPILDMLIEPLEMHKQEEDMYIFGGNAPYTLTMIRKRWEKYVNENGLDITQHQLRHSYATMLYRAGIDPKTAQELLGHADIQTTLNIYTHISDDVKKKSVTKINKFLKKVVKK